MFHFTDNFKTTPDISRNVPTVCRLSYELFHKFYLSMVGSGFTSNDAYKENNRIIFYGFMKAKLSTYFE